MRAACILFALLAAGCATPERAGQTGWTKRSVSGLTIKLVNDSKTIEWLRFAPNGIVLVNWGTAWKTKSGDSYRVTTNPALDWKFVDGRVQIYDDGKVAEELTLIRREGSYLVLRMKSGKVGRFQILREER